MFQIRTLEQLEFKLKKLLGFRNRKKLFSRQILPITTTKYSFQDTNKKPMVMVRVVKDHDLVIEFSYVAERKKFLAKLENFLQSHKKSLETVPCFRDHMLMNAETKEKRKLR